jgi:hypothetical protein
MPVWLQQFPIDPVDIFALQANRVTPLMHDFAASSLELDGSPQFFALGSVTPGTLRLNLGLLRGITHQARDQAEGLYASLLDTRGNELWRAEAVQDTIEWATDLEPGQTYLLTVNSPSRAQARLTVDLPGTNVYLPVILR